MPTRLSAAATLAAALLAGSAAAADPPSVVPVPPPEPGKVTELTAAPGRLLVLSAEPASKWLLVDDGVAELRSFETGKFAAFAAAVPGRYRLVVTGPDGTPARVVVVVGDAPPGPGPKPPTPPDPVDPLKAKLRAAYDADPAPAAAKSEQAKDLAALYRQASKLAESADVATSGDLLRRVREASASLVGADALKGVRQVVAGELGAVLPTDAALSDAQRGKVAVLFKLFAQILEGF